MGRIGTIGIHHHHWDPVAPQAPATSVQTGTAPIRDGSGIGLDPALLSAEQIEIQLFNLNELLNDELPYLVEEGGSDISNCVVRLERGSSTPWPVSSALCANARPKRI